MKEALFASIPFIGHLNPLLRQASELARRGWRSRVASLEEARAHVEAAPGVEFVSLGNPGPLPWTLAQVEAAMTSEPDFAKGVLHILRYIDALWPAMFDGLHAAVKDRRPDVMIADYLSVAGLDVAEAEGIEVVINDADLLVSLPGAVLPPADHLPLPFTGFSRWRLGRIVPWLHPLLRFIHARNAARLFGPPLNAHRRSRGLPPIDVTRRLLGRLILIDSAFGLEYPRPLPPLLQMVGPMLPEAIDPPSEEESAWLSDGPPVVYANLGTVTMASEALVRTLAEAFTADDFRVLWVLRKEQHALLPSPLPKNVRLERWVTSPLGILAHPNVEVFVSHCGINSVHESMFAGTPIVGIPMLGDQLDMALRVQDAGVGLMLSKTKLEAERLRRAIRRVLQDPSFARNIPAIQSSFVLAGGTRRAADLIEHAARVGVAHYR